MRMKIPTAVMAVLLGATFLFPYATAAIDRTEVVEAFPFDDGYSTGPWAHFPGTGDFWDKLDEGYPGDGLTTYAFFQTVAVGNLALKFDVPDLEGEIQSVDIQFRCENDLDGLADVIRTFVHRVSLSITYYNDTWDNCPLNFADPGSLKNTTFHTNPATGLNWTLAELQGGDYQFGLRDVDVSTYYTGVTFVSLQITLLVITEVIALMINATYVFVILGLFATAIAGALFIKKKAGR